MSSKGAKAFLSVAVSWQILTLLGGCEFAGRELPESPITRTELTTIRSRVFETTEREKMLRTIIATLQDLGFVVDRADHNLASVSGTKLDQYLLRLTVTVTPQGTTRLLVRANARYDVTPVLDPDPYQKFFAALAKALSLEARQVD